MKKMILFLCAFLLCQAYGAKEKIFEMSYKPQDFVKFFDSRLENYWRIAETDGKNIDGEFLAMLKSFKADIRDVLTFFRNSGIAGIEEIECESYRITENEKSSFRTDTVIEFDGKTEGFLQGLLKKLPEHKIQKVENEDEYSDLHVITDDTLLAFDLPLNFVEAFKALPKDFSLRKKIDKFTAEYLRMGSDEFIDRITGEWGGVVYINRPENGKGEFTIDFIFIIPDVEQKFYKTLCEELVMRRRAIHKKDMLNVRLLTKYPEMVFIPMENMMMISSSPAALVKFGDIAEKKSICRKIKDINVPEDIKYDAFIYRNKEFAAAANSIFFDKSHPLKFMTDFCGSDVFTAFEVDDDELEIKSYSDISMVQMLLIPYTSGLMLHADNFIYRRGRDAFVADRLANMNRRCIDDLKRYAEILKQYAQKNKGSYPAGVNEPGLKILAEFGGISPEEFASKEDKKTIPFGRFYYWGENCGSKSSVLPLLSDRGGIHKDKIHILFCDGSIREFELKNVRSARRIASFLHTVFNYDSATFDMLMKQAERLEREKL